MLCRMNESAYPCPVCRTVTTLEHACPGCGRDPDPNAAAVITLDQEILDLSAQVETARRAYEGLAAKLAELHRQRENYATLVRAAVAAEQASASGNQTVRLPEPAPIWNVKPMQPVPPDRLRAEASPRTVQNLLFILGGLLLGVAAIVFTAVAWANYGAGVRAFILAVVTLIVLSIPPLVKLRGLKATAETFAALGMLLILLDGYAAWFVNLGGIQQRADDSFYAGSVCAVTAVVGFFYGRSFNLLAPLLMGLLAAQPVLPLYFAQSDVQLPGWAMVFGGVALGNAALIWRTPGVVALRVIAAIMHVVMLLVAGSFALTGLIDKSTLDSSLAIVVVALVMAAGAAAGGQPAHRAVASAAVVMASVAAVLRPLVDQFSNERLVLAASGTAVVAALVVWGFSRYLDNAWITGARWGSAMMLSIPGAVAFVWATTRGALTAAAAVPWWHAGDMLLLSGPYGWEMPLALGISMAGGAVMMTGRLRKIFVIVGVTAMAFALPGAPAVTIWAPSTVDLVAAAALLVWALVVPGRLGLIAKAAAAGVLVSHALLAGQATAELAAAVMTGVVVIGLSVSAVAPKGLLRPSVTIDGRHELAGVAAGVTDLMLPWLGFTLVAVFNGNLVSSWRTLAALVLLVPLLGSGRQFRGYHVVASVLVALYPLWPDLPAGESPAIYAAIGAVAMTLAGMKCSWTWVKWAPALPAVISLIWAGSAWYQIIFAPFNNLAHIWAGNGSTPVVALAPTVALTLLLVPVAVTKSPKVIAAAAILPALAWLAYSGVPWPVIPAVALIGGLTAIVFATLRSNKEVAGIIGVLLMLSGMAGALPAKWTTITGLALISVTMAFVGARIGAAGWIAGAVAKVLLAYSIGQAANLMPEVTAYLVLAVAGLLMAIGYLLAKGSRVALEASAHSAALVALSLCAGAPHHAAGVLAIWGVVVGLTALGRHPVQRAGIAAVIESAAWIVLLRAEEVSTLEAYTLPVAVLAVAAGILAALRQPGVGGEAASAPHDGTARSSVPLTSWLAYGPALAAALLPSLGAVLIEPGGVLRRLLLGTGALLVTVAGAVWRRQAPFILGGVTLLVLAAHEIALVWQLLDAWIPLGIFGLLLVGLAITYERRLRELTRLRDTVSRMT